VSASAVPQLQQRTLDPVLDKPGVFVYGHKECVQKFLGACVKVELKNEFYDVKDKATWEKLVAMGFVLVSRDLQ